MTYSPPIRTSLSEPARPPVLDLGEVDETTALLTKLGRCRTYTLMIGAFSLTAASMRNPASRDRALREMAGCVQVFTTTLAEVDDCLDGLGRPVAASVARMRAYAADVLAIDTSVAPSEHEAEKLVWRAWDDAGPALQQVIECCIAAAVRREAADRAEIEARAQTVLSMCDEMAAIGRTIHLISLNAAVEAARAGGESGRIFGTIAQEVRSLAARAAKVIEGTRKRLGRP